MEITRFAPSPSGLLHVGNARTALINFLYAKKHKGNFLLRIDDTNASNTSKEFCNAIFSDLRWLSIEWKDLIFQSKRTQIYKHFAQYLISIGKAYPCYETKEELEQHRQLCLVNKLPPKYNRASLKISQDKIKQYEKEGRNPYYRFKLDNVKLEWNDLVRGNVSIDTTSLSDPVIIKEDGSITYLISSVIDDIEYSISTIIRGEDHITNTAIQIQMMQAIGKQIPQFAHISLLRFQDSKISKRVGGHDIQSLKNKITPLVLTNFLSQIGTSDNVTLYDSVDQLTQHFDLRKLSTSNTQYDSTTLARLNKQHLKLLSYSQVQSLLNNKLNISEKFWDCISGNVSYINDIYLWHDIIYVKPVQHSITLDQHYLKQTVELLPEKITETTWKEWSENISKVANQNGKELILPIRVALTGLTHGPSIAKLLQLMTRDEIVDRIQIQIAVTQNKTEG
ncbi:glutamate--tRNA ligase [Candidatus Sneabacter namystus]|uniref:Glutamate--tRNA ligase n=1 Tax=Candidatus Sneabacter namystus TaxID=2601646 RepID=A0A5C0UIM9_9RICK|nr:glutamate--tRNA ligase [Candidatus Sneabacter namystus]QEK39471.1 glutamate--tRNA ligase [Candidatus Sneabacter namystus]